MNILNHYKKLIFFNFKRMQGDNYRLLREYYADLFIHDIGPYVKLNNKKILDVGGARGEFCKVLNEKRSCDAYNLEPDPLAHGKYSSDFIWENTTIGFADNMPYEDNEFDVVICRGVLEHIPKEKQQNSINEMIRVLRPGGICYIMIPPWFNPHAGHDLKPFHYLPFNIAKKLSKIIFKREITSSSYDEHGLYPITARKMMRMIKLSGFQVLKTQDVHFRLHFLTRIPILNEFLVPAIAYILKKDKANEK